MAGGVLAKTSGSVILTGTTNITTAWDFAPGVSVESYGTVTLTGPTTIATSGASSSGLSAYDPVGHGSIVVNGPITVTTQAGYGALAGGGDITFNQAAIISSSGGSGLVASGAVGGIVANAPLSINVQGGSSGVAGILSYGRVSITSADIIAAGIGIVGVQAFGGGTFSASGLLSVTVTGLNSGGVGSGGVGSSVTLASSDLKLNNTGIGLGASTGSVIHAGQSATDTTNISGAATGVNADSGGSVILTGTTTISAAGTGLYAQLSGGSFGNSGIVVNGDTFVTAQYGAIADGEGSSITFNRAASLSVSGASAAGLWAGLLVDPAPSGSSIVANAPMSISVAGDGGSGVYVQALSRVSLTSADIKVASGPSFGGTFGVRVDNQYGYYVGGGGVAAGGAFSASGLLNVTMSGQNSAAVYVYGAGSTATLASSVLTLEQGGSSGLYATNQGAIRAGQSGSDTTTIVASGFNDYGVRADSGASVSVSGLLSVQMSGQNGFAVYAYSPGSTVALASSHLTLNDIQSVGLVAENGAAIHAGQRSSDTTTIVTSAANSLGVYAGGGGSVTLTGTTSVSTAGNNSIGLSAYNAYGAGVIDVNGPSSVTTQGSYAHGAAASGGDSRITFNADAVITTSGDYATGLLARLPVLAASGSSIVATAPMSITVNGIAANGVEVEALSSISLASARITVNGDYAYGVLAANSVGGYTTAAGGAFSASGLLSTTINGRQGVAVAVSGPGSTATLASSDLKLNGDIGVGLYATNGGAILAGQNNADATTIALTGVGGAGVRAEAIGSITLKGTTGISTAGAGSVGLQALGGAIYARGPVDVITLGDFAHGAQASGNGAIFFDRSASITTSGAAANGLLADNLTGLESGGQIVARAPMAITVNGAGAVGAEVEAMSKITLTSAQIAVNGDSSYGAYVGNFLTDPLATATGSTATDIGGKFSASGPLSMTLAGRDGFAVAAVGAGSTATLASSDLRLNGANGIGLYAAERGVIKAGQGASDAMTIVASGADVFGAIADNGGAVTFAGPTSITLNAPASGTNTLSAALWANNSGGGAGGTITANGPLGITLGADNAIGVFASGAGSSVTASGATQIALNGANGVGVSVDGGLAAFNGALTISGAGANGVGVALTGAAPSFSATGGGTIATTGPALSIINAAGFTARFDTFTLSGVQDLIFADPSSGTVTFNSTTASAVTLVNAVGGGNVDLIANASTLSGAIVADAVSTVNVSLNGASTWNVTGSSNVGTLVNNGSAIVFSPTGGYKTLTVGSYSGAGGATMTLNAQLGGNASAADRIVINGGAATGSTLLTIRNSGGLGALTTGYGIPIVLVQNGGTTAAGAFALAGPLVINNYQYALVREPDQAYYLQSTALSVTPLGVITPLGGADSFTALGNQRAGQIITSVLHGGHLLGSTEQINCTHCASSFASFGSFALGGHGRWAVNDQFTALAGMSFNQYGENGATSTGPMFATSLRFDPTGLGDMRPFGEVGGMAAPLNQARFSRAYTSGGVAYVGRGSTSEQEGSVFGRAGVVARTTPQNEISVYGDLIRSWRRDDAYGESPVNNPFPASFRDTTVALTMAKATVHWSRLLGSSIEVNLNAGFAHGFGGMGVTGTINTLGPVAGARGRETNWFEYVARVGYRVSDKVVLDGFVFGTAGGAPVGPTIHGGVAARYLF
jgi:hypothetical protein